MEIRRRHLWWLVPVFALLFGLGAAIATWTDKPSATGPSVESTRRLQIVQARDNLVHMLEQVDGQRDLPFEVIVREQRFSGHYRGESFALSGSVNGHAVTMVRQGDRLSVSIDGREQDAHLLPYALYTPYEHLSLIKGLLPTVDPQALLDPEHLGLRGYRLALPPEEVKSLLALWLGPNFPTEQVMNQFLRQVAVTYELWYDGETKQLREMTVDLRIDTPRGVKQDQLLFRM